MNDLFNRLQSERKRVITKRQLAILEMLLVNEKMDWFDLWRRLISTYSDKDAEGKSRLRWLIRAQLPFCVPSSWDAVCLCTTPLIPKSTDNPKN